MPSSLPTIRLRGNVGSLRGIIAAACLIPAVVPASASSDAAATLSPDHGIIHFFEPATSKRFPIEVTDPVVVGQEAIFWWADLEPEEGKYNWAAVDAELKRWNAAGKPLDLRIGTAHLAPNHSPAWLFERAQIRRIGRGQWCDFEESSGPYEIGPDAQRTTDPAFVLTGSASLAAVPGAKGPRVLLKLKDAEALAPGVNYSFQFDAISQVGATGWVTAVSAKLGVTNRYPFAVPAAERVSRSIMLATPAAADNEIWVGLEGAGDLVLDNVNAIRIQPQPQLHRTDFERTVTDWKLLAGATVTRDRAQVIKGRASLLLANNAQNYTPLMVNEPTNFRVQHGQGYSYGFDFKALTSATLRLRLVSASAPFEVLDESTLTLKAGMAATHFWNYPSYVWRTNCVIEIGMIGPGTVVMDDLFWSCWSERVTCFPDYFNPAFREKWERFITAVATRYSAHPGIGCISVGGFGRWEEVILDDDGYGSLDPQWLARGFTPQKYLEHVTWCMDLFKRLFPQKPLRICLAYGLYKQNDRDYIYRRVAQAAVARGIGLKQNGLSEKYDAWDDNTSASYLVNRYRFTPGISLTYETAGQMSHLSHYSYGHPLSVLNRALLDGIDYLFLYPTDINARHVHKYLHWVDDQIGRPLNTTLYCRLGDYSLVTEASLSPQGYRNQWLGLREFSTDGAVPALTLRNGVRCAATREGAPHIVFDVDDRQQYHGMNGVVVSVRYLDEGADDFEVNCFDQPSGGWKKLGHVRKSGSGEWKVASFPGSDWCRSRRNGGEDVHADLVINDLGDGIEHIADVALEYVPAREWQRELIASLEPSAGHVVLTNTLSREIVLLGELPLHWIAVPVWSGSLERSALRGRVFARTPGGEVLVSDKEYHFPADKDWFELPVVPVTNGRNYRIELSEPKGSVGWYRAPDGGLAYRAWRYSEPANAPAAISTNATQLALGRHVEAFESAAPFFGLRVNFAAQTNGAIVVVRLRRQLFESVWSDPFEEQRLSLRPGQAASLYFEPQTAGRYQVELQGGTSGVALIRLATAALVEPLRLVRREQPHPPRAFLPSGGLELVKSAAAFTSNHRVVELTAPMPILAATNHVLAIQLRNTSGAPLLRVTWARQGQPLDDSRSALVPLVQNDTGMREYYYALGADEGWHGEIGQLQLALEPASVFIGTVEIGDVRLVGGELPVATN